MRRRFAYLSCFALLLGVLPACTIRLPDDDDVHVGINLLFDAFDVVQVEDPRTVRLPPALITTGRTVVIDTNVTIITDATQIIIEDVPDSTVIGFENLTGYDIYVRYRADGELQGIFVFDGETLLLDYPCLSDIELVSEEDFDPDTGVLVDEFELDSLFLNPEDFTCGEALLLTFDPFTVTAEVDWIDLLQ